MTPQATRELDGFQPVFALTLDVEAAGWGPQRVSSLPRVPPMGMTQMVPGRRLRVSFDPGDPAHLTVDWSATDV